MALLVNTGVQNYLAGKPRNTVGPDASSTWHYGNGEFESADDFLLYGFSSWGTWHASGGVNDSGCISVHGDAFQRSLEARAYVSKGKSYTYELWYKGTGGVGGSPYISILGAAALSGLTATEWTKLEGTVTPTSNTLAYSFLGSTGTGEQYFDNFKVHETEGGLAGLLSGSYLTILRGTVPSSAIGIGTRNSDIMAAFGSSSTAGFSLEARSDGTIHVSTETCVLQSTIHAAGTATWFILEPGLADFGYNPRMPAIVGTVGSSDADLILPAEALTDYTKMKLNDVVLRFSAS